MKTIASIFILISLTYCQSKIDKNQSIPINDSIIKIQYSEKELSIFLDSIANLQSKTLIKKASFLVDSTLNNQKTFSVLLKTADFQKLKKGALIGKIDINFAKTIFPEFEPDSLITAQVSNNLLPINFYSFDKNTSDFNKFAISLGNDGGYTWDNDVYFFKENNIIAKHTISHHYGIELNHFKNEANETVFYYSVNYESGTGIWWHQFNFYMYINEQITPVLTEIKNINLQFPWSSRAFWIESAIVETNPLTLKFVYNNQFPITYRDPLEFINDSTQISYTFKDKKYQPMFEKSTLNKEKLASYFLTDNELLFVKAHAKELKKEINGSNKEMKKAILYYLNELKNKTNFSPI